MKNIKSDDRLLSQMQWQATRRLITWLSANTPCAFVTLSEPDASADIKIVSRKNTSFTKKTNA